MKVVIGKTYRIPGTYLGVRTKFLRATVSAHQPYSLSVRFEGLYYGRSYVVDVSSEDIFPIETSPIMQFRPSPLAQEVLSRLTASGQTLSAAINESIELRNLTK